MTLNFPNQSRSLDEEKERVRFWGHDGPMEISFFVEVCAIRKIFPELGGVESSLLGAFDAARNSIQDVAAKAYARGRRGSGVYVLTADDF